ncbi:MAG TPA: SGNH/GDSL hydrolase family protein [Myxococcota bacterium]|nr:SGNH/GDSL hydrolase family protein [Myxococcota bacterium]
MPTEDPQAAAEATAQKLASEVLARRQVAHRKRAAALAKNPKKLRLSVQLQGAPAAAAAAVIESAGYLVAIGDSWFDYPLWDVLKRLDDDHGYTVQSTAHYGDPVEAMAYHGGQIDGFARCVEKVLAHGIAPKAVLVSGGGNDIAGQEFGMLLNSSLSPIAGWNDDVVAGALERIRIAYRALLGGINRICQSLLNGKQLPILVHGYDYPVPDGRGFLGGGWILPGPWLQPGFREKAFDDLQANTALMRRLIDNLNVMLATLAQDKQTFPTLQYVDVRNTLSTGATYKDWWANELHPTEKGFEAVANKFATALAALP